MKMTNKKLKKKIKELKDKHTSLKDESEKIKNSLQFKQEELTQIKADFNAKQPKEDKVNDKNNDLIDKNNKLFAEVLELYKANIDKTKKKIRIDYSLDLIRGKSQIECKRLQEKISEYNNIIREIDDDIQKSRKDLEKNIKSSEIAFDVSNYIFNPSFEYTDHVAESQLAKQVIRRLERLLKHCKSETEEIKEEYAEIKADLEGAKEKYPLNIHNTNKSNDDTKMTSKELFKKNEKAHNEEDKEKDDEDNEEDDKNLSIEVDTSTLTKEHIDRFIESPHFIDKVVTQNSKLIKPLKLCLDVESPYQPPIILKVKHVEKEKISLDLINSEIEETMQSIALLRNECELLLRKNKQLTKKKDKLIDNLTYANNKIEILSDQIELIDEERKVEEDNRVPDNIREKLQGSYILVKSNFNKQ